MSKQPADEGTDVGSSEPRPDRRTTQERAEEIMEHATGEVSRFVRRMLGRAREEAEDILAEAQTVKERWGRS